MLRVGGIHVAPQHVGILVGRRNVEVEQPGRYALTEFSDGRCSGVPLGEGLRAAEYQQDGGDPEHGLLFMCAVMFVQQFLPFVAKKRTVLLFTSLFFGAAGFGTLGEILDVDFEIIALALGMLNRLAETGMAALALLAKANLLRTHEVARVQPMLDLLEICR